MSRKPLRNLFLRLFLPVAGFVLVGTFFFGQAEVERELVRLKSQESLSIGLGAGELSRNLDGITRDLHFLQGHSALRQAVESPTPRNIGHLTEDLRNFSHGKGVYDQVRWIDETGMEIVRIDRVKDQSVAISADKLQNKGQRYFFTDTFKLKPGEIFVSPLDLNVEQDKIEVPYKPMVRVATPVSDRQGGKRGIVILNYYGSVMLNSFAQVTADIADHVMVVNRDGYWLKSPKPGDEWGFMFGRADLSLAAKAAAAWARIRSADRGQELLADGLWTWISVYPLLAGQKSSTGAVEAFVPSRGEVEARQYVWKAVAHLSEEILAASRQAIWLKLGAVAAVLLGLLGTGAWKLAGAWAALAASEEDVRRLNAALEQQVDERTRELREKVSALDKEIAERKDAVAALQVREERFRMLFDRASDGIMVVSPDGRIVDANESFARMHGYSVQEMLAMNLNDLDTPETRSQIGERMRRILAGEHLTFEVEHYHKDGHTVPLEVSASLISAQDGVQVQCFHRDIAERKQIEAKIRQINAELERRVEQRTRALQVANSELESFSYSVSHDLRAPLRAIEGFSSILETEYAAQLDERGKDYFKRVRSAAVRMARLIDDMLKLSRISRQEMHLGKVNLSSLAREAAEELQATEPQRRVDWIIAPNVITEGDSGLLRIALQNLIGNAWKYSSKRELARIEFGVCQWNGRPAFFVRDNGAGFDMDYADKLFGAFQRLHAPDEFAGTGIGLATVKRIIYRHGGQVGAEGSVHEGATFYFSI